MDVLFITSDQNDCRISCGFSVETLIFLTIVGGKRKKMMLCFNTLFFLVQGVLTVNSFDHFTESLLAPNGNGKKVIFLILKLMVPSSLNLAHATKAHFARFTTNSARLSRDMLNCDII